MASSIELFVAVSVDSSIDVARRQPSGVVVALVRAQLRHPGANLCFDLVFCLSRVWCSLKKLSWLVGDVGDVSMQRSHCSQDGKMIIPTLCAHSVTANVQIGYNPSVKRYVPCAPTMDDWCGFLFNWIPLYLDKMVADLTSLGCLGGGGGGARKRCG